MKSLVVLGTLPDTDYCCSVATESIAVRVGAQACIAHPRWMTREQVQTITTQLSELLRLWDFAEDLL
jgi:hypothetical protein